MMMPNMSFTGGAGGEAKSGDSAATSPFAPAFGSFQVGGHGNQGGGGTASASAATGDKTIMILTIVGIALGALALVVGIRRR
jgi:LPXTG-motif cell wall-anchored protein